MQDKNRLIHYSFHTRNLNILLAGVYILSTLLFGCNVLKLRRSDQFHISANRELGYETEIKYLQIGGQKIRCLTTGSPKGKNLLLLHGSPSSLSAWSALFADSTFMRHFRMIAIDRPGYGYSNFGHVETSIQKQATVIGAVMDSLQLSTTILLGSSYGGPVAAQIAMNRPQQVEHLVFLSASVQPGAEKTYGISHLMTTPVVNYLFPAIFRMSSKEKFSHAAELSNLQNWNAIQSRTSIIHGDKDQLVYFSNAEYLQEKIPGAKLFVMKDRGHALIFSEPDYLKKLLLEVLTTTE